MIKISALNGNKDTEEENDSEIQISEEALLQIASQQYAKALELQRKGCLDEATQLLKELLETELLDNVKIPGPGEVPSGPLNKLKYLCYKNLAYMLQEAGDIESAIECYSDASDFDDTDVTLWYRMGLLCMQAKQYEKALLAFQHGCRRNPQHWLCLDNIVKLLLGLNYREQCIITIHEALQLDPGYLRGIVYRRHIYTVYKYMRKYMEDLNPIYKWNEDLDGPIDEALAGKLLKEAEDIYESFVEQRRGDNFVHVVPRIKLKKSIAKETWEAVGESLVHMHQYQTEHCLSHACFIDISSQTENTEECMEVCEEEDQLKSAETKLKGNTADTEKVMETVSENENNDLLDKDKAMTDSEKVESDIEMVASESATENNIEDKSNKKNSVRRRGSALSFLHPWEWFTRGSVRKKTGNIVDILRKMVPPHLKLETARKIENQTKESSPDISDLDKLFPDVSMNRDEEKLTNETEYFGSEAEETDVRAYIKLYTENSKDIIDMLHDYLKILSDKWNLKWPDGLCKVFVGAAECYKDHVEVPTCMDDPQNLTYYCQVNLVAEELAVNEKLMQDSDQKSKHDLNVISAIDMIVTSKPHLFSNPSCLEMILRSLWVKFHVHLFLNKSEDMALETGYDLLDEFDAMGEFAETYSLNVTNFKFKSEISRKHILSLVHMMERNKKLLSVMELYNQGNYDQVIAIITESFDECKIIAMERKIKLPLDFPIQLTLILESYWASDDVHNCLKWSFISLHESLEHYFDTRSGSDYEMWTLVVIKMLTCIQHILLTEGILCLDSVGSKELSEGVKDLIRIIGHQVETKSSEMPFNTFSPWIILHYILQREEDRGRGRSVTEQDSVSCNGIPYPLMLLFIAHDNLGERNWCCNSDGEFLYFILDTVAPCLRSPLLSNCYQNICQYMEQVVLCLYAHPNKITNKMKHLRDHKAAPKVLNWKRAEQIYDIFRPVNIPAIEGINPEISMETEALFQRILSLLPAECDPSKYITEIDKYIKGIDEKLTPISPNFPYKIRDIYLYLSDYYFKREDQQKAIKYSMLDITLNNDRFNSWALLSLSKVFFLDRSLNLYKKLNNERDYLIPAKSAIRCFKRALELNPRNYTVWLEFGNFVYNVHSYCSRLLKQDSESLSMEEFAALERQKEDLLDESYKCYTTVLYAPEDTDLTEDSWPLFYMLGKVAEKRNKPPSVYLDFYMQGIKKLHDAKASYPSKINYKSPPNLSIKVLELHYRMHASILKYIEQHENKPIPASVGEVFLNCIEKWLQGPFVKKPKDNNATMTSTSIRNEAEMAKKYEEPHAANILKRSISDAGEEDTQEVKRLKIEAAAAKIRRSASYDTERIGITEASKPTSPDKENKDDDKIVTVPEKQPESQEIVGKQDASAEVIPEKEKESVDYKKEESSSSSSSTSSSDSNSSDSSSSSSDSSSDTSSKASEENRQLSDEEIMKIVSACLNALEDCAIRYQPNYKAIYRLAHYHFYYKKGRDIERCRDLMLSTLTSRSGQKMCGLFSEKKTNNFFNNIWKFPGTDIERAGGFAFHMNRCVLLTLEIFKEIDDHKTLLDLSLHLQIEPDLEKKYLRDSDREDLAQQAFSLCIQLLKGQLLRFSQQSDLKTNEVERHALKSFMADIYKAYLKVQKTPNAKHLTTLLADAYKLISTSTISETVNLVDLSIKYCQSLNQTHKQQPIINIEKSQSLPKKQSSKFQTSTNSSVAKAPVTAGQSKAESKSNTPNISTSTGLPKISAQEMAAAFQSYVPMLNDISPQAVAALSLTYLSNISALAGLFTLEQLQTPHYTR
nr:calcineurin-binding protein cabin-1-like [Danaus plexippus plexippus]